MSRAEQPDPRVREAIQVALEKYGPFLYTDKHIDLTQHPQIADAHTFGRTLQALWFVMRGMDSHLPSNLAFDETTAAIVASRVDSLVPAWDIYGELSQRLAEMAREHQQYLAFLSEQKSDPISLR
jgi:hypothetical protein